MKSQIQTSNVNSTELWVELDEQQSSELVGGSGVLALIVPDNSQNASGGLLGANFNDINGQGIGYQADESPVTAFNGNTLVFAPTLVL